MKGTDKAAEIVKAILAVIPREGVESLNGTLRQLRSEELVIPREGVERTSVLTRILTSVL